MNSSPMGFDNRFRYGQAHSGALDAMPLVFPSIEFFEDVVDFVFFDPRPPVRNTDGVEFATLLCRDPDELTREGVELRVGNKVN